MYVGGGVNVSTDKEPYYDPFLFRASIKDKYVIKSDNGTIILFLHGNRIGGVTPFYSAHLLGVVGNMFSQSRETCKGYIGSWFYDRHKIKDYMELLSISTSPSS